MSATLFDADSSLVALGVGLWLVLSVLAAVVFHLIHVKVRGGGRHG